MSKEEKKKEPVDEVNILKEKLKARSKEEKKRLDRIIRQMKEGKLETLGTIVVSDDGNIFIHIVGDKLISMTPGFLGRFKDAIKYLDFPEGNLLIARLMEFEAKQMREYAKEQIEAEKQEKKKG